MSSLRYPRVVDEDTTLQQVLSGKSIARYGDGEFKIVRGQPCVSQVAVPALTASLREILVSENPQCLVGIPRLVAHSPKYANWRRYEGTYPAYLSSSRVYHSAFISRPDSAPWIWTPDYYDRMQQLWRDMRVGLVAGSERSLTPDFLRETGASEVVFFQCRRRDAYAEILTLKKQIIDSGVKRVILCAGPMATVLAWNLSLLGVHAIDLGHIGMFWYTKDTPQWMQGNK